MRVISGKYRGKKLQEFELSTTRPTQDRVKESIFNLIQFEVAGAVVLDLFSGTGALGIEAISRGARKTIMVDSNPQAVKLINQNLKSIDGDYQVIDQDYAKFLSSCQMKFDIVLLDPPFATDFGIKAIQTIINANLLNEKAIIIFETSEEKVFDFNNPNFKLDKRKYGTVSVYKIEKL